MKLWATKPLGEVATCLDSQRIPVKEEDRQKRLGSVPYYGANGQVGWIDKALFDEPLLLVAEDGGHFNEPEKGVAYTISGPAWVNNHAHVLRPDRSKVLLDFLGYHFRHFDFTPYITGTTRGKLTQRDLMRVVVPVPSLAAQERTVKLLNEADELRKLRNQADRRSAGLITALFHDRFGDPIANEKKWEVRTFGDLTSFITSGSRGWAKYYSDEGSRFIRVQNLTGHRLTLDDVAYVKPPNTAESRRTRIQENDLLLAITGNTIGLSALASNEIGESYVSQHVAIIRLSGNVSPTFIACFMALPTGGQRKIAEMQYGHTKPGISLEQIGNMQIPLPPLSLQEEFSASVDEFRSMETQQAESRRRLDDLFQSILHRAFNGEL